MNRLWGRTGSTPGRALRFPCPFVCSCPGSPASPASLVTSGPWDRALAGGECRLWLGLRAGRRSRAEGCIRCLGLDLKLTLGILCYFSFLFASQTRGPSRERGGPRMAGSPEERTPGPRACAWSRARRSPPARRTRPQRGRPHWGGTEPSRAAIVTARFHFRIQTFASLIRNNDALKRNTRTLV